MFASKDIFLKSSGGYQISRSVRTRSSASAYFNRTFSTPTLSTKWTWSGWVKRGTLGAAQTLFSGQVDVNNWGIIAFLAGDTLSFQQADAGSVTSTVTTTQVFRDPSAWYHIVVVFDSTQATAANRLKMYVNGVQVTAFGTATYLAQNTASRINAAVAHQLSRYISAAQYFDGYLTEINFIDGQALTPSSFGETNAVTGVWQPIKYTGTYGTNGFYLNFSDNSGVTATTIGKDYSGNGNNWTPNNISVTAGVTYDSMLDVPTPYADGGNGRGNYAVLNPLWVGSGITTSNANLTATASSSANSLALGTIAVSSGKWYWESTIVSGSSMWAGGVVNPSIATPNYTSLTTGNSYAYNNASTSYNGQTGTTYGATYTTNDVIGTALDLDTGAITFYKNGVSQGVAYTGISGTFTPMVLLNTSSISINFGQRPFAYTPPTGFVALNTQNLPTPTISNGASYMAATTYTGNNGTQAVANTSNGVFFQPDFVWVKNRTNAYTHLLYDSVRGVGTLKAISSSETTAEGGMSDNSTFGYLSALNSNGFTVVSGSTANSYTNSSSNNYIAWQWNAGGSTVTNTSGSISSQVRANPTAGFSVVTYTGTGANATVGHGLGVAPRMIIVKSRSLAGQNWHTYHAAIDATSPANYIVILNGTVAKTTSAASWNNTAPTSNVFSIGTDTSVNNSTSTYVAYCFAAVAGYSAFGKYTGNGSTDGPFVFLGFRPRWVMFKRSDVGGLNYNWFVYDSARDTYNAAQNYLEANLSTAEQTSVPIDFLSNGFKFRTASIYWNTSGGTYIYAAFSEVGFKYALGR